MGKLTYLEVKSREAVKRIFAVGKGRLEAESVTDAIVALLETQLQKASGCGLLIVPDTVRILSSKVDLGKFTPELLSFVLDGLDRHIKIREYLLGRKLTLSVEESASAKEGAPEFIVRLSEAKIALTLTLKDLKTGKEYLLLPGQTISLGRASDNTVVVPDELVSSKHASVEFTTGCDIFLSDLGSANGTYFKGAKVDKPVSLKNGDLFQLTKRQPFQFEVKIVQK